jgi:hypothetical protein
MCDNELLEKKGNHLSVNKKKICYDFDDFADVKIFDNLVCNFLKKF